MDDSPYAPLNPGLQEIRLLEIAPGDYEDDLVITMRTKRLRWKRPRFNGLSYFWGKEQCPRQVMLNGQRVTIGQNLDTALRQLRISMNGYQLWVDALCINQEDIEERSQQVRLMGDIFSTAERVIVWLGPERKHDRYAVDMITRGQIPVEAKDAIMLMRTLKRICLRPWFGRVWVAQEVALAKREPTIQLGPWSFLWDGFCNYIQDLRDAVEVHKEAEHWPFWSGIAFVNASWRPSKLNNMRRSKFADVTQQLREAISLRASDPRDQVYGLLGLCTMGPHQRPIVVDYSKSARQVFLESTCAMLLGELLPYRWFPLHPPCNQSLRPSQASMHLPSWAFDLSMESRTPPTHYKVNSPWDYFVGDFHHDIGLVATISHLPQCSRFSEDLERLHTIGFLIGTICDTSADLFYDSRTADFVHRGITATNIRTFYRDVLQPRRISSYSYKTAFILKDQIVDSETFEQILTEDNEVDRKGMHHSTDSIDEQSSERVVDVLSRLGPKGNRIMFVTKEGHLGILYHPEPLTAVQPGDVVVGLFGINCPFVLRPFPRNVNGEQSYSMINIAYVVGHQWGHDFVKGSGPGAKWEDFERFGLREYTII